jgi:DNA excision repair protein ERCC-4
MDTCVAELRKSAAVDLTDLTLEKGMTETFDHFIRRQLEPVWNKVSFTVRGVVNELKTLRKLLSYLLRYDAVTFYTYLETLHTCSRFQRNPEMWMLTPQAEVLFTTAKARLFTCIRSTKAPADIAPADRKHIFDGLWVEHRSSNKAVPATAQHVRLQVNLQANPKWTALLELLHEVQNHWVQAFASGSSSSSQEQGRQNQHSDVLTGSAVLVITRDERTSMQLSAVLQQGAQAYLLARFKAWLLTYGARTEQLRRAYLAWAAASAMGTAGELTQVPVTAEQLLLWQALERCDMAGGDSGVSSNKRPRHGKPASASDTATEADTAADAIDLVEHSRSSALSSTSGWGALHRLNVCVIPISQVVADAALLADARPTFMICYDPDPWVTRHLEVYKALHASRRPLRVYFVLHDNSVEQHSYTSALAREQDAFEKLIHAKAHMALPAEDSVAVASARTGSAAAQSAAAAAAAGGNISVKRMLVTGAAGSDEWARAQQEFAVLAEAGGDSRAAARGARLGASVEGFVGVKDEGKRTVVVDMREFRSKLPSLLHAAGMHVVPITLNVGDFILSPEVCVERKSIPDLYGSFASGRLHSQATAMTRSYQRPVLLIEFDTSRPFALMSSPDLPTEIEVTHIISKMVLLTTAFPTLRIMWSRSAHATVDIFMALKQRMPEPDAAQAALIGTDGEVQVSGENSSGGAAPLQLERNIDQRNDTAIDMLRCLPGVTGGNYRTILSCVDSLAELCALPLPLLSEIMGPGHAAQLHGFLHRGRCEGRDDAEVAESGAGGGVNIVTYFQEQSAGTAASHPATAPSMIGGQKRPRQ